MEDIPSGYLTLENHHAIKFGKQSISMGHLYHGYVSHNQMVVIINSNRNILQSWMLIIQSREIAGENPMEN